MRELSAILQHYQPDVCCFQETVVHAAGSSHEQAWEPLGYEAVHALVPTWPGAIVAGGRTGNTIVARLPVREEQVLWLPSGRWPEHRCVVVAEVVLSGGRGIHILNTHLAWRPEDDPLRARQVRAIIADVLAPLQPSDVILCGDLNATPESPALQLLLAAGLTDAWSQAGCGAGHTWSHRNPNMGLGAAFDRRIDYILPADHLQCRSIELVGVRPIAETTVSDHFGLIADISL